MTDQTTPPDAGDQTTPPDAGEQKARPAVRSTSTGDTDDRFAAYDTRLEKFVGGVHPSKKAATDAAKARKVKAGDIDVRKV